MGPNLATSHAPMLAASGGTLTAEVEVTNTSSEPLSAVYQAEHA